ncbi:MULTISPECIES: hypothetical protein [Amycolatopsis]|uniref:hypothetical protein n=1 Tax=Amycolatopsis TaxID=1813 RepID=UPI000B8B8255|nr:MULTISPECIES: hypothetical protein [Amycolatopsis]OXM64940.1 hypothetical protein CF166_28980 [Amycolatopsis sp. KNN50.9b]
MDLVERYVTLWNETDASARRKAIELLWPEDGVHLLQPPREMRDRATALGFADAVLAARGYAAIEERVRRGHEEFLAPAGVTLRARGNTDRLGDVVKFGWELVDGGGQVRSTGLEVLTLAADGRIAVDHQVFES